MAMFAAPTASSNFKWRSRRRWAARAARPTRKSSSPPAYAACFHSALKRVAAEKKVAIAKPIVEARVGLGPNDRGAGLTTSAEAELVQARGGCLKLALLDAVDELRHRCIHGDRHADLLAHLRHVAVDEVDL